MIERSPDQDRRIAEIVAKTSAESGLDIHRLTDPASLRKAADNGLLKLYQNIFAEPPYHEKFSEQDVLGYFSDTLVAGGLVFTLSLKNDFDKVSGFVSSLPLSAKKEVAVHVKGIGDIERTAYFAEDGVARDLRRQGVSAVMKRLLLESNRIAGYDQVLLRTSIESYPQISAVTKAGGRVLANIFQQVSSRKQNGAMALDTRVFYMFTAGQAADPDVLSRVTVIRPDRNDVAIVRDQIPPERQGEIIRRIRTNYAGIKQVVFSNAEIPEKTVKTLFDAKMYLPR